MRVRREEMAQVVSDVKNRIKSDICSKMQISRSKMIREFKKNYNTTPHAYLLDRKISFAKMLLQNSRHSIKSISAHLCFASEKYFASIFKEKTGMSPSQYRKTRSNIASE